MISFIIGKVLYKDDDSIVVVNTAGVGYDICVPQSLIVKYEEEQEVRLHTEMVVRENSIKLFGFPSKEEKVLLTELMKVQGVGAKTAVNAIDLGYDTLCEAILGDDEKTIMQVNGIGKAGARRICQDMKKYVEKTFTPSFEEGARVSPAIIAQQKSDISKSLLGLGYKQGEVDRFLNDKGGLGTLLKQGYSVSDIVSLFLRSQDSAA